MLPQPYLTAMLLLDLDDTIFPTRSIPPERVQQIIDVCAEELQPHFDPDQTAAIIAKLWHRPFDVVMQHFAVSTATQRTIAQRIRHLTFHLDLQAFPDYPHLLDLPFPRILVTTGFTKLQEAKIAALGIAADFEDIYIDDPPVAERRHKIGWIRTILARYQVSPAACWVIGDNPDSELRAGKDLGMNTIQRLGAGVSPAPLADHAIHSFADLGAILRSA